MKEAAECELSELGGAAGNSSCRPTARRGGSAISSLSPHASTGYLSVLSLKLYSQSLANSLVAGEANLMKGAEQKINVRMVLGSYKSYKYSLSAT